MNELEQALQDRIGGGVRCDDYSLALYSTDASIYDVTPVGVAFPRTESDVVEVMRYAYEHGVPVLPRGGGTSLSGQAVGAAIILDFTRHMQQILEVNEAEKWVRVQPGVVLDDLNRALKPRGLKFGPDPASSSRASMGGIIGNNSTGAHSILYAMAADHVLSLRIALSNGDVADVERLDRDSARFAGLMREDSLFGQIVRGMAGLGDEFAEECRKRYPGIRRNVAGYNLKDAVSPGALDLPRLLCGSEGTLAVVLEAKLRLVDLPQRTGMVVLCFRDLIDSLRAVAPILEHGPSAVEVVDKMLLGLAARNPEHGQTARSLPEGTEAVLMIELYGEDETELRPRLEAMRRLAVDELRLAFHSIETTDLKTQTAFSEFRKAGLPILLSNPGDFRPTAFIEDTAVPPESLPDYISEFLDVMKRHGTSSAVYAHAGAGCLHLRPIINLKDPKEVDKMLAIADEVTDLVIRHGGTTSSEHGDGMARTQWLRKLYGDRLVDAFGRIKRLFDPKGILNPGKIVSESADLRQNLRYRPTRDVRQLRAVLRFDSQIDLIHAVELCNGCGECRNLQGGTMCPSFRGTKEEITATRGRANLMRQALTGKLPRHELTSRRFKEEVLDLCLACKACKRECSSGVDVAKLKTEIKHQYIQEHGAGLWELFFGNIDRVSQVASLFAPLTNWLTATSAARILMERTIGIDRRRELPRFQWQTFTRWFRGRPPRTAPAPKGKVAFFYDCYLNHNNPEIGQAAVNVLETLGYEVVLADRRCCGRAMLSVGMVDSARQRAIYNVSHLAEQVRRGYTVVGCEPSCIVTLQDDYRDMLGPSEDLELVQANTFEFMEFLNLRREPDRLDTGWSPASERLIYHGHCHQKATGRADHVPAVLRSFLKAEVVVLDSGCCGMAGAFGYDRKHYELSLAIAEALFALIREHSGRIVVSGVSCRTQIEQGLGLRPAHPAEVLAEHLPPAMP
jgi:FAD/FMN-containing dehydrogenase/Fe-S oxidoreductase